MSFCWFCHEVAHFYLIIWKGSVGNTENLQTKKTADSGWMSLFMRDNGKCDIALAPRHLGSILLQDAWTQYSPKRPEYNNTISIRSRNGREWGFEIPWGQRKTRNGGKVNVATSSVVPRRPPRLRDWDEMRYRCTGVVLRRPHGTTAAVVTILNIPKGGHACSLGFVCIWPEPMLHYRTSLIKWVWFDKIFKIRYAMSLTKFSWFTVLQRECLFQYSG